MHKARYILTEMNKARYMKYNALNSMHIIPGVGWICIHLDAKRTFLE